MNLIIEIRERMTGVVFHRMPLYEFLQAMHTCTPAAELFEFHELLILVDGEPLIPSACGHA